MDIQRAGNYQLIMVGLSVLILILSIKLYQFGYSRAVKRAKEVGVRKLWVLQSTIVIQFETAL
jgi:hypothetical protein